MEAGEAAGHGRKRQRFSIERDFGEAQHPETHPAAPETKRPSPLYLAMTGSY
jgi:hypothetical protein